MPLTHEQIKEVMGFKESETAETIPEDDGEPTEAEGTPEAELDAAESTPADESEEGKPTGKKGSKKVEDEDQPLAEYGLLSTRKPEEMEAHYRAQFDALQSRITELESELENARAMKSDPIASMSKDDLNQKLKEYRDEEKYVEAEELYNSWKDKQNAPAGDRKALLNRVESEVVRYARLGGGNEALIKMLADEKNQARLSRFAGLIRADRTGGAEVLHLVLLGLEAPRIYTKGVQAGRTSVGKIGPGKNKASRAVQESAQKSALKPGQRKRLSDVLAPKS